MGRSVLKIERKSVKEIQEILSSNPDFLLATRLNMVQQVAKGHSSRAVANWYGVSFKQVTNWVHRFEKDGIDGLFNRPGRGRKCYLSDDELEDIKQMILVNSPADFGINDEKWSGPTLLKAVKNIFGVEYKATQVYKLVEKMGLKFQKGRGIILRN